MAKTTNYPTKPSTNGHSLEPLTAAVAQLQPFPKRTGLSKQELARSIDIQLQGSANADNELAWYFYNKIPELRYIARYVANSLSQARLFVGRVDNDPFNPARVDDDHPAQELLAQFAGGFEGQAELLDRLGLHLTVRGDSIAVGPTNPNARTAPPVPFDQWRVWSTNEIVSRNGQLFYRREGESRDTPLPSNVTALRIWRPHPKRFERADSPVLSSFTVLREIDLLDQHVHASAISRLAGAGLLLLPDDMTFPDDEVETEGTEVDTFIRHLTEVMSIAIKNRDSAAAMVPIMLRGPSEAIDKVKHLTFSTPFDDKVPELRNVALRRLALGMDVPPEVLLGMSESTQWSAWQTDESTVRLHTVPLLQLIVNSLTVGWFKPQLKNLRGVSAEDQERLTIWFDISNLRVRPNVTEEAESLFDRFQVGGDTLRITTGFTASEKPTKKELEQQILFHLLRNVPELAGYAINALREKSYVDLPEVPETTAIEGRPLGDQSENIDGPRSTPGKRSQDKQVDPPPTPEVDKDQNNNEVGR